MGYSSFKSSPKAVTTGDSIGNGEISLRHLDPGLFAEIRSIALHNHKGSKSRRIDLSDLQGAFGINGFFMYSSDGTKRYQVTIDSGTDAFVLTEA